MELSRAGKDRIVVDRCPDTGPWMMSKPVGGIDLAPT
jgi:hypothetical protein